VLTEVLARWWGPEGMAGVSGRRAVVTGANGGIGLATARALAAAGATVVLACRDLGRAEPAVEACRATGGRAEARRLDLADLASVAAFCETVAADGHGVDLLVNNAGVMAPRPRAVTADGFEAQLGTNHLGHFALTAGLWTVLAPGARVVTVASTAADHGRLDLDDLQSERRYVPMRAYAQSKLANLLFSVELDRRLRAAHAGTLAVAAHPGYAATGITGTASGGRAYGAVMAFANRFVAQPAEIGALPVLAAAVEPDIGGGEYLGPAGPLHLWGPPRRQGLPPAALDPEVARALWEESERLTGVTLDPSTAATGSGDRP
jgi:NAD(P)-dependent dehydrogenase (short-subunit alcohol dehydrogenase family)